MPFPLYLDTARLGPFNKKAQAAHTAFLRLAGELPTARSLIPFLRDGAAAWHDPVGIVERELTQWQGIRSLERSLAGPYGATKNSRVYLASRSTTLVRLGIEQLFKHCRRCLTVDLSWPSYLLDLEHIARRRGGEIVVASIKEAVFHKQKGIADICELVYRQYTENRCDGLFLPVVDHLGIRIPVVQIVETLRNRGCEIRFVMLDASQAYTHVSMADDIAVANLAVAGTHKWLGSYFPLGVAISPKISSSYAFDATISNARQQCLLDDSLLTFVEQINGNDSPRSETVNLGPLFSAFGAISDGRPAIEDSLRNRIANADIVSQLAIDAGWRSVRPSKEFRTGILLLEPPKSWVCSNSIAKFEQRFLDESVYVTIYDSGLVRLAMPCEPLTQSELDRMSRVFAVSRPQATPPLNLIREGNPTYQLDCLHAS